MYKTQTKYFHMIKLINLMSISRHKNGDQKSIPRLFVCGRLVNSFSIGFGLGRSESTTKGKGSMYIIPQILSSEKISKNAQKCGNSNLRGNGAGNQNTLCHIFRNKETGIGANWGYKGGGRN